MSRPATPKQIAYLTYMGIQEAHNLSSVEASDAIDNLFENEDMNLNDRLRQKQSEWTTDRFVLYPELYADVYAAEIKRMLDYELPEILHSYVRTRIVGASEKLTKAKIKTVIQSLLDESPQWWQAKNKNEVFFNRLGVIYPSCVDGHTHERISSPKSINNSSKQQKQQKPQKQKKKKKSGNYGCIFFIVLIAAAIAVYLITKG